MPLEPLNVALSDGQKIEVLKRFQQRYTEELKKLEVEMTEVMTQLAEADFLGQYLGEQPEVVELRKRKPDLAEMERRRTYLGKIIDRLAQVVPAVPAVKVAPPNAGGPAKPPAGLRRY